MKQTGKDMSGIIVVFGVVHVLYNVHIISALGDVDFKYMLIISKYYLPCCPFPNILVLFCCLSLYSISNTTMPDHL